VACAGGELVTLGANGGPAVRTLELDNDLRDVVVDGDNLLVSRFRSAESPGDHAGRTVTERMKAAQLETNLSGTRITLEPAVAWRMVAFPGGRSAHGAPARHHQ